MSRDSLIESAARRIIGRRGETVLINSEPQQVVVVRSEQDTNVGFYSDTYLQVTKEQAGQFKKGMLAIIDEKELVISRVGLIAEPLVVVELENA